MVALTPTAAAPVSILEWIERVVVWLRLQLRRAPGGAVDYPDPFIPG